ncbi:ATP synthase, subunit F [Brevipalpus obovatus]|uniref:ATP synthase, subunit F n=1 Tax=Brevipalpus obovatus TaxID=246614 RepID=UPI003D9F2F2C
MSSHLPAPVKVPWYRVDKIIGCYHPEYDRKLHGPYNPGLNYSAVKDIHWSKVKVRDFPSWLKRRNFSLWNISNTIPRLFLRYEFIHAMPYRAGANGFFTMVALMTAGNAILLYKTNRHHKLRKYHW